MPKLEFMVRDEVRKRASLQEMFRHSFGCLSEFRGTMSVHTCEEANVPAAPFSHVVSKHPRSKLIQTPNPPLNRGYNTDRNIKALTRRGAINHGSTVS